MKIFTPDLMLGGLAELTAGWMKENNKTWIAADLDNTVAFDGSDTLPPQNAVWLENARDFGIEVVIISNNGRERVERFAKKYGLKYIYKAKKPDGAGVLRAAELAGRPADEGVLVGDQIFTDIWAARRAGIFCVLVDPVGPDKNSFIRLKRGLELLTAAGRSRKKGQKNER